VVALQRRDAEPVIEVDVAREALLVGFQQAISLGRLLALDVRARLPREGARILGCCQ
jgi:hypothetical protein